MFFSLPSSPTEEESSEWFNIDPETGQVSMAQDLPPDKLSQPVTLVVRVSHTLLSLILCLSASHSPHHHHHNLRFFPTPSFFFFVFFSLCPFIELFFISIHVLFFLQLGAAPVSPDLFLTFSTHFSFSCLLSFPSFYYSLHTLSLYQMHVILDAFISIGR